jgi:hypothetical protein
MQPSGSLEVHYSTKPCNVMIDQANGKFRVLGADASGRCDSRKATALHLGFRSPAVSAPKSEVKAP